MKITSKVSLEKEAREYIEASQLLKAAQQVLDAKKAAIIPAFNKFCRPDEKGNRKLEFGPAKIMLVPTRTIDEDELKAVLGQDKRRFTERHFTVALHLIRSKMGEAKMAQVEDAMREAINKLLADEPTLLRECVKTHSFLDKKAAFAHLSADDQKRVKEQVGETLRPYPEKKGFTAKLKAAIKWLSGK